MKLGLTSGNEFGKLGRPDSEHGFMNIEPFASEDYDKIRAKALMKHRPHSRLHARALRRPCYHSSLFALAVKVKRMPHAHMAREVYYLARVDDDVSTARVRSASRALLRAKTEPESVRSEDSPSS